MSGLTPLAPLPPDLRPWPQTLARITAAELRRLVRQGGLVVTLGVSLLAALVVGLGSVPLSAMAAGGSRGPVTTPLTLAPSTAALVLAVGIALHVGSHGQRGTGPATMVLVPDRHRLLGARALALAALTAAHLGLVVLLVGAVVAAVSDGPVLGALSLALLGSAVGGALLAVLAAAVAVLADHPVGAALALGGWWVVLPITVAALARLAPAPVAAVGDAVVASTPSLLVARATDPGGAGDLAPGSLLVGLVGLAAWAVAVGALALLAFQRRTITRRFGPG